MAAFGLPGGMEWVIILAVVLLLFGPSRLPKLGKSLGKTMKAIRDGVDGKLEDEDEEEVEEKPSKKKVAVEDEE
ncbi:MAG: twin-arginine translocase TatA/TatE family subunit [Coriobacteriia bacterium]|nr:twin-arginine translocase TatA/TatE family subunit [Coriobacteriia bacterium]MBN2822935.1 twin-arginine translocase TatA/TatE family subunit [Coriobacteriia bacterium]